jgi:hypothetical protein
MDEERDLFSAAPTISGSMRKRVDHEIHSARQAPQEFFVHLGRRQIDDPSPQHPSVWAGYCAQLSTEVRVGGFRHAEPPLDASFVRRVVRGCLAHGCLGYSIQEQG